MTAAIRKNLGFTLIENGWSPRRLGPYMRNNRGFTLIELLITVVVLALLVSIAYPSYTRMMIKVRRSDAHESLMKAVALQEQFYVDNKQYATTMVDMGYVEEDGKVWSRERYYTLTVTNADSGFKVLATPAGSQVHDTDCGTLSITDKGVKETTGTATVAACW